jgi:hypothetical protein
MQTNLQRAAAYLERMPPAIAGSGGHSATFNTAAVLVRGFALTEHDALPLLAAWNQTHCQPPWTEAELRHKLRSAATSTRPLGYLLDQVAAPYRDCTAPDFENEAEKKARQRKAWPEFKPLKPAGIRAIAELRRMLPDAVDLAHRWGFVKGAEVEGQRCFIIHEGIFAQARRLDGGLFTRGDGTQIKAKNLPGSGGAFIGQRWLGDARHILLVEGAVGLLEALAAFALVNMAESWSIIAATSATSRFARDPDLLARLSGRHVRIVPDADEAGLNAAASWLADLEAAGAMADAMPLPDGIKDLGALVAAPESHAETLNTLFQ